MDKRKYIRVEGSIGQVQRVLFELYISTADLIAELEKRRPCERCVRNGQHCFTCKWNLPEKDNFKEAK